MLRLKIRKAYMKFIYPVLITGLTFSAAGCTNISDLADDLGYKSGAELVADARRAEWPFEYTGSFNVPDDSEFNYVDSGLAFNPDGNGGKGSLFSGGHDWRQMIAEISIPDAVIADDVEALNEASFIQNFTSKIHEKSRFLCEDGSLLDVSVKIGGLLVYNGELYGTAYAYYSGAGDAKRSHFKTSLDLSDASVQANFKGMFTLGDLNPGITGGYMCVIPSGKRYLFGGASFLTGQAGLAIITRSSFGPSAHAFSPEDLVNPADKVSSKALVYYPGAHQNLGRWDNKSEHNPTYNMTTKVKGIVYPDNSEYVYFIGETGLGIPAYGAGSKDPDAKIYDPVDQSKGCHAWPYVNYLWIYHEDDLAAVFNDTKEPWEIKPAADGVIDLPYYEINKSCGLSGVSYDPVNEILYICSKHRNGSRPVVHVYKKKQ